jgi:hypothetical protein
MREWINDERSGTLVPADNKSANNTIERLKDISPIIEGSAINKSPFFGFDIVMLIVNFN